MIYFQSNSLSNDKVVFNDESADITLKFSHDLGEVLNYKPKFMIDNNKKEIKKLTAIAKKDIKTNMYIIFFIRLFFIFYNFKLFYFTH